VTPLRPYLSLARMQARAVLAYRLNFALSMFAQMFQLFAMLAIWGVLLSSGTIGGFDWPQMKAYLLIGFVSSIVVSPIADWRMVVRIQDGMVALDLAKPVDYQTARFAEVVGALWTELFAGVVVCAGVVLLAGPVPLPSAGAAVPFALSMLAVVPLKFLIVYLSATACFYTQNYLGVQWARLTIVALFSGALVPLAFLPGWLQAMAAVLPFASLAATPGLIYIGQVDGAQAWRLIAIQYAWVLALWIGTRLIWHRAVRQVTIHGG
jgi:ABC-2 type transport system permease protein